MCESFRDSFIFTWFISHTIAHTVRLLSRDLNHFLNFFYVISRLSTFHVILHVSFIFERDSTWFVNHAVFIRFVSRVILHTRCIYHAGLHVIRLFSRFLFVIHLFACNFFYMIHLFHVIHLFSHGFDNSFPCDITWLIYHHIIFSHDSFLSIFFFYKPFLYFYVWLFSRVMLQMISRCCKWSVYFHVIFFLIRLFSHVIFTQFLYFACFVYLFICYVWLHYLFMFVIFFPHASSFYTIRFACVYLCIFRGWQSYVKCMAFFIRVKKKNIYRHVIKVNVFCPTTIMLPHEPVSSLSSLFSFFILFKTDRKPAF